MLLRLSPPSLSLVVDLTNTDRYYDWQRARGANSGRRVRIELQEDDRDRELGYVKVRTQGHVVPSDQVVAR